MKCLRNVKNEKCIAVYFTSLFSHFASFFSDFEFHTIFRQGQHPRKMSKDFIVHFFAAVMKHTI